MKVPKVACPSVPVLFAMMESKGLTAKQVSIDTGIPASNFTEWKKGRNKPSMNALMILADYFKIPVEKLANPELSPTNIRPNIVKNPETVQENTENQIFDNEILEAYSKLSHRQQLEIQLEILKKAEENETK